MNNPERLSDRLRTASHDTAKNWARNFPAYSSLGRSAQPAAGCTSSLPVPLHTPFAYLSYFQPLLTPPTEEIISSQQIGPNSYSAQHPLRVANPAASLGPTRTGKPKSGPRIFLALSRSLSP